jgi:hypothetical protein
VLLDCNQENGRQIFKRISIVYDRGLQTYKEYAERGIQLDGTHLTSSTKGVMLSIIGKDGNNQIFTIAICVVAIENQDNWIWFLNHFRESLQITNLDGSPKWIISDQGKGLTSAVSHVFPESTHCFCYRHYLSNLFKNLKISSKKGKGKLIYDLLWKLGKSWDKISYEATLKRITSILPQVAEYIGQLPAHCISLVHSKVCRYGVLTSNNAESWNNMVKELRDKPILEMLISIEELVCRRHFERKQSAAKMNNQSYTKIAKKWLDSYHEIILGNLKEMYSFNYTQYTQEQFILEMVSKSNNKSEKIVLSTKKTLSGYFGECDCGFPFIYQFPCLHLYFIIFKRKLPLDNFISYIWKASTYKSAYFEATNEHCVTLMNHCCESDVIIYPPVFEKRIGRPKKKRIPSQVELEEIAPKKRSLVTCKRCGGKGHMQKTCRN